MSLNPAQEQAIHHGPGPAMVLAGPGSGKTLVITHRTRNLIEEYHIAPEQILVITFTRAAANEMKERFDRLMCGQREPVTFGTFHSVFFRILKAAYGYSGESILRQELKKQILKAALEHTEWNPEDVNEALGEIESEISAVKGDRIELQNYYSRSCPNEVFREVYDTYEKELRQTGKIDFDDMMTLCFELFRERRDILAVWQKKYRYILIDEFQDINRLQYEIVRMLAGKEANLFVVGDDDQSIYRFRGAKPEIMLGFMQDFPDARQILLDINYRSVPSVVEAAGRLIGQNSQRFRKKIHAEREKDVPVEVTEYPGLPEENDDIIRKLEMYHRAGIPYEEMALLYRTNQAPRVMAEQMIRVNIPFSMGDMLPNIYEHWITGDILTYMLIAAGSRKRGDFLRIINRPNRFISRACFPDPEVSLEKLKKSMGGRDWMEERVDRLVYDLRMLTKMKPYAAIHYIRKGMGYEEFIESYAEYRHVGKEELMAVLDELQESAQPFDSLAEWMNHMREYGKRLEEQKEKTREKREGVSILTMHGSKGLEYQVVFIPDANEGQTPHSKAVLDADLEEERRLFYVAMTRAKTRLHISYVRERFHREQPPSRFVREIGLPPVVKGNPPGNSSQRKK